MKREKLQVRPMLEGERYVDFNGKPIQLLGYVFWRTAGERQLYPKSQNSNCPKWSKINHRQKTRLTTLRYKLDSEKGHYDTRTGKMHFSQAA